MKEHDMARGMHKPKNTQTRQKAYDDGPTKGDNGTTRPGSNKK